MSIRSVLAVAAIPVLTSVFSLTVTSQAIAANSYNRIAQATAPNQPPHRQRRPARIDFVAAATKLGVTPAQLKNALEIPAKPSNPPARNQRPPRPDFKAAAAKLGVTEKQLTDALGIPPHPPGDRPAPPSSNLPG